MDDSMARETTVDERMTWGTCPACKAAPGEWCRAEVGVHLGRTVSGASLQTGQGAHLARLQLAPRYVKLVAVL